MIKFREFIHEQREYVNPDNIKSSWKNYNSKYTLSKNQNWHPDKPYSDYNAVWVDSSGKMIRNFTIIEGKYHKLDKNRRGKDPDHHDHLRLVIDDLRKGYVFDDNDRYLNPLNPYSDLDTCTHMLSRYCDSNKLVYSKCLTPDQNSPISHRLTYEVYKPEVINNKLTCKIVLNNFIDHRYNDKDYSVSMFGNRRRGELTYSETKKDNNQIYI